MMNTIQKRACIAAVLSALILVGCGQKGPLTLPKPQFPAPDNTPSTPPAPQK